MGKTTEFVRFALGRRKAITSDTEAELSALAELARDKQSIIEVGVYEGVASLRICRTMNPNGKLYLVDPYFLESQLEKLFRFSFTKYIASKTIGRLRNQVQFVKYTSLEGAAVIKLHKPADLIFIDARHDYQSVHDDFLSWSPKLASDGLLAFHDSHVCPVRPDLHEDDGPVVLLNEILAGKYGDWKLVKTVDSLTVISR